MTREEILEALTKMNNAIARLTARLNPPPLDANERQELQAELEAAEQARAALLETLNNLPETTPPPDLGSNTASPQ
jgi:hypothetical protein